MENKNMDRQKSKMKPALAVLLKIIFTLAAITAVVFGGSLIALILVSEYLHMPLPYIGGYLLPALLLPVIWLKQKKKYMKIWLMIAALCFVVLCADFAVVKYDESITVNTSLTEYTTTAQDPFVFIAHRDNPVDNLTTEQIRGIYSAEITNWQEVGGGNKKIRAYQCEAGSESQNMMERFMGEVPLMEAPTEMGYGYLFAWEELVSAYRNKPDSIGYCVLSCVKNNPDVKVLSVDGAAPSQENIENGSYPFVVLLEDPMDEEIDEETDE